MLKFAALAVFCSTVEQKPNPKDFFVQVESMDINKAG